MSDVIWVDPHDGFQYNRDVVMMTTEEQHRRLLACQLDPAVFGDIADPSNFIGMAIHAGIASGISAEGNVNMLQSLIQHRQARLDEPLHLSGEISRVVSVPRGKTVDTAVWFVDEENNPVITATRRSLKPDPEKVGERGAGDRPAPVVQSVENLSIVAQHQLTPDAVKRYSMEGNSIHYDMKAANLAGFRAPIIGGGMGVHYLMSALFERQVPNSLDLDIYFRRPIFWDDALSVGFQYSSGEIDGLALVRDGKVLTEIRVNNMS